MNNKNLPTLPGIGKDAEYRGLPNIEKSIDLKKERNFKRSGHVTDQFLKYNYKNNQTSIFDILKPATKQKIEITGIKRSEVAEGIKLTPAEIKVVDALSKLLHHSSQNLNPNEKDYYIGNLEPKLVQYGEDRVIAPQILITLYQLTKEYKGQNTVSGKDVDNVFNILLDISKKPFLIRYKEERLKEKKAKTIIELEMFEPIIRLPNLKIREYNKEGIEISKIEKTLIVLHPIFIRQIDTKFIIYPNDINRRTIIAYGSHKISKITLTLREYLIKHLSIKNYTPEIMLDRLYYLLAENYMKQYRKSKVKKDTEKAIDTMIKLGLLESFEIETAKTTREPKIIFKINKNFE
ncbi:hypothetical protein F7647_10410 [Tenacibaculum piscium]|uniref:hypothetical protein n=1 Tax=Tenacibaculum piscium TaxID=1458515 RepID=UPI00187B99A6|nr:hypothetical protein [Tenacibaculum piscium]MBE7686460.1 hypothetical protein [Tenacibaculum piscium]